MKYEIFELPIPNSKELKTIYKLTFDDGSDCYFSEENTSHYEAYLAWLEEQA